MTYLKTRKIIVIQLQMISDCYNPAHISIVREMFDKEAKKFDALNHQGIAKLIAYFEDEGEFYLVQEFIDGNTLD